MDARTVSAAGELLRALSAPARIQIVLALREAPTHVNTLVDRLGLSQPLVSQHLRVLRSAGVVEAHRDGRGVEYRLVDEHLSHIVADAVDHVQESASG